ncbi:MAG: SdpI family protein [bacterium]
MPNPIKPTIKTEILPLLILAIVVASSFYFYSSFPDRVPTHWNFAGEVDGWGSRAVAAFVMPGVVALIYLLMLFIPHIDPKKDRYKEFQDVYHKFKALFVFVFSLIYFISGFSALGYSCISMGKIIPVLIGLLFIFLGYYMGRIKPNWFMGIRTPWTLSSEEVWNKTHKLGGKTFMFGGAMFIIMGFLPAGILLPLFIAVIALILFVPIVYSYLVYRKINDKK